MTETPAGIRASDAERERVAKIVQNASAEGRLTIAETEERLGAVYAAKYTGELNSLTADLPPRAVARATPFPPHRALRVHAALVVALSVLLVVRWILSDAPFFWPIAPMFWLAVSLFVHARIRGLGRRRREAVPY
ncbi:DUF1707 SHOCT-like domain-containing protein [Amycolatopsis anabasis]|uniref:DUF1707 SHOCT-like domain-containing protein n=1 Tax=Amycolatopsis anabasis TaxID=1840409 RepID=UPI00131C52F5|nr:DUF1707 domain-containing protein [Amycolatopsis anabasis]